MHNETNECVQRLRSKVLTGIASLGELEAQLAGNADKYLNQLLQQASNWFDDVEVRLGILKDNRMPPRNVAEELRVLDHAEFFLERVAEPQLKAILGYGRKVRPRCSINCIAQHHVRCCISVGSSPRAAHRRTASHPREDKALQPAIGSRRTRPTASTLNESGSLEGSWERRHWAGAICSC
jgi:hypothetical protein